MAINLQKKQILEKGSVVTLHESNFLVRAGYEFPALDKEINLDLSAFLLDESSHTPSAKHFIFYSNLLSPDKSVECFDDTQIEDDPGGIGEMTLRIDLARTEPEVIQIVVILTIHEAGEKDQTISDLHRPYIRFCNDSRELYRFELIGGGLERSLEFCRILRNGCKWVLVATGVGSSNELIGHVSTYVHPVDLETRCDAG